MVVRTWARMLLVAAGAGALVATSQLGLAYGLGIVRLTRVFGATMRDHWPAQLAWVAWLAMVSAAAGAWLAGWAARRHGERPRPALHGALAAAAGVGALVVVPLAMQPARTAQVVGADPVVVIGISAGLGAVAGAFAGYAALASWTARLSLLSVGAAVWLIALVSVVPFLGLSDQLPAARLGVLDATFLSTTATQRFALVTMPAIALVSGAALGWVARRRELPTLTIATAGLAGPALLTAAYLIAGPGDGGERYQSVPYWAAMIAAAMGALGSVLAAVIRRTDGDADTTDGDGADAAADPTAQFATLPGRRADDNATTAGFGAPGPEARAVPGDPGRSGFRTGDRPEPAGDPELTELFARRRQPGSDAAPSGGAPGAGLPDAGPTRNAAGPDFSGGAPADRPVVPASGNAPNPPEPSPPRMSKLRRRRSTGAELGAAEPAHPAGPAGYGPPGDGTSSFVTGGPAPRPPAVPEDPFHPGQPVGGGLGRRLPEPRSTSGPRSPQPMQSPPAAPAPATLPPDVLRAPSAPGRGAVPQQRPGDTAPPPFAARPIGEQPFGATPFSAFGPPADDDPGRSRADRPPNDGPRTGGGPRNQVPAKDTDYVDWVSGLGDR